jgi:hypothetical protein
LVDGLGVGLAVGVVFELVAQVGVLLDDFDVLLD